MVKKGSRMLTGILQSNRARYLELDDARSFRPTAQRNIPAAACAHRHQAA